MSSRKIIQCRELKNVCHVSGSRRDRPEIKAHHCLRNYSGSSKGMEPDAVLEAYEDLFRKGQRKVFIGNIIADDDSSMRSYLRHKSHNDPKGALLQHLPQVKLANTSLPPNEINFQTLVCPGLSRKNIISVY